MNSKETISRRDDERLYQPKLHSRWIRELYRISQRTHRPMTVEIEEAVKRYIEQREEKEEHERTLS